MTRSFFDTFDIDPLADIETITERLRGLMEDTQDPDERARIRAAWEELTMHPRRRLDEILDSHPSRPAPGRAPPRPSRSSSFDTPLTLRDLRSPQRLADLLGPDCDAPPDEPPPLETIFD